MEFINNKKVKFKNLLNIVLNPTYEDLLYEIVNYLTIGNKSDGIFNLKEANNNTKYRIGLSLEEDLKVLEDMGYIKKLKYSQYQVIKHLWE